MELQDFVGRFEVEREQELVERLHTIRCGTYGAFILSHGGEEALFIHINDEVAVLAYFPDSDGQRGMFVPDGMWNVERPDTHFLQVGGGEADAIWIVWQQLVPLEVAYRAGVEFFRAAVLPQSVSWQEL